MSDLYDDQDASEKIRTAALAPIQSEGFMRQARIALSVAHEAEVSGQIELADACGAIAANKIAAAIKTDERVHIHECQACDGGYRDTPRGAVICRQCSGSGKRATNGGEP